MCELASQCVTHLFIVDENKAIYKKNRPISYLYNQTS